MGRPRTTRPRPERPAGGRTARLIESRAVDLPPEVVFAALTDPSLQSRWILATRVRATASGGDAPAAPGPGGVLVARTAVGGIGFDDTMRVTEYEPPRRWRVEHVGRLVRGWGQWGVLPRGESGRGCRVYWAEEFELPLGLLGRLGWAVGGGLVRAGMRVSLARLVRGIESGSAVPS